MHMGAVAFGILRLIYFKRCLIVKTLCPEFKYIKNTKHLLKRDIFVVEKVHTWYNKNHNFMLIIKL